MTEVYFAGISPVAIAILGAVVIYTLILNKKRHKPIEDNSSDILPQVLITEPLEDEELDNILKDLIINKRLLEAIKVYKENRNVSLMEAKDHIDSLKADIENQE